MSDKMRDRDRLTAFDERLNSARMAQRPAPEQSSKRSGPGPHAGMQIGVELVGGVIGGLFLGYGVDYIFDSSPIGLVVFLVLGSAAGMLNAYRYLQRLGDGTTDEGNGGSHPP